MFIRLCRKPFKHEQCFSLKSKLETENIEFECETIVKCEDITSGCKNSKRRKRTARSDNIFNFLKKEANEENRRHEAPSRKRESIGPK